jgi:signal transduction histidine kinase
MDTFTAILKRVEEKRDDYATYNFERLEMAALNTFFDLAQEYDNLDYAYIVSVTVPRVYFGLHCNLYIVDPKTEAISLAAGSHPGPDRRDEDVPGHIEAHETAYRRDDAYVVPIQGKRTPSSHILFYSEKDIIGIFEVLKAKQLADDQLFFIEKYVNRIGYNLYNKFLAEQNIQHLKFINNLVADIEHNVIVPNIRYKHYFKQIRKYLSLSKEMEEELDSLLDKLKSCDRELYGKVSEKLEKMIVVNRGVFKDQEKIEQHYKHTSLFLESLFRPDHFLFGEYILRKTRCYLCKDIVVPQLERYRGQFSHQGIVIDKIVDEHKQCEGHQVKADKGLLAQVVANLFSNATKYTESIEDGSGNKAKKLDCGVAVLKDFFGSGHDGIRFSLFTSGKPIDQKDAMHIFDEGFRLADDASVRGTGHGLHFVKNVVEVHGGVVGHNADNFGNEFYFVIPA